MKAISLWQPWASLMVLGHKRIETRTWKTDYTGELAIHAAKRLFIPDNPALVEVLERLGINLFSFPRGAIVGTVKLIKCIATGYDFRPLGYENLFGDYTPGRYGWITTDAKTFDIPIPCRGRQGLFDWEPDCPQRSTFQ